MISIETYYKKNKILSTSFLLSFCNKTGRKRLRLLKDPGCVMCAALLKINPAMVMYCLHTPIHFCPSFTRPVVHFWSIFVRQMETKVSPHKRSSFYIFSFSYDLHHCETVLHIWTARNKYTALELQYYMGPSPFRVRVL